MHLKHRQPKPYYFSAVLESCSVPLPALQGPLGCVGEEQSGTWMSCPPSAAPMTGLTSSSVMTDQSSGPEFHGLK